MGSQTRSRECENCGGEITSKSKLAKYCSICRLYKNIMFIGDKTVECQVCEDEYSPTERGQFCCRKCSSVTDRVRSGECKICGSDDWPLIWQEAQVCVKCMDDPEKRGIVARGLMKRIVKQKKESATLEP